MKFLERSAVSGDIFGGMRERRFRTRKEWHNVKLWTPFSVVFLMVSSMFALDRGQMLLFIVPFALASIGLVVAWRRDRSADASYSFDGTALVLRRPGEEQALGIEALADVSLIDRAAARDYILQRTRDSAPAEAKAEVSRFMRFCTVDIGITSYSFGFGRRMTDGMMDAKRDLVLVRLRNGGSILLSPQYNHDLVDSVGRILQLRSAG